MGRRHKYADPLEIEAISDTPEHKLHIGSSRRFDPVNGASDSPSLSLLIEYCSDDWSWKPQHNKHSDFRTFLGVPKSAAETHGPRIRN
jgi:hypothetical protein